MRGFTKFGDGDILEYNFTTLGKLMILYQSCWSWNIELGSSVIMQAVSAWNFKGNGKKFVIFDVVFYLWYLVQF